TQAWDYAEYFYDVKAWIPKNLVIMNKEAFDELPDAPQDAVMEAADRARERSWSIVQDILERAVRELKEQGMTIVEPGDEIMQEFREVGEELTRQGKGEAGERGIGALNAYHEMQEDQYTGLSGPICSMMQSARRALAALRRLCALLALICLAGIALIILAGVLGRMVGILVPDTATISGMLLGMTVFL